MPLGLLLVLFWIVAIGAFVVASDRRARVRALRQEQERIAADQAARVQEAENQARLNRMAEVEELRGIIKEEQQAAYARLQQETVKKEREEKKRRWQTARSLWLQVSGVTSVLPGLIPFEASWIEGPPPTREPRTDEDFETLDTWLRQHKMGTRVRKQYAAAVPQPSLPERENELDPGQRDDERDLYVAHATFNDNVARLILSANDYEPFETQFIDACRRYIDGIVNLLPSSFGGLAEAPEALYMAYSATGKDREGYPSRILRSVFLCDSPEGPFDLVGTHILVDQAGAFEISRHLEPAGAVMFMAGTERYTDGTLGLKDVREARRIEDPVTYARITTSLEAIAKQLAPRGKLICLNMGRTRSAVTPNSDSGKDLYRALDDACDQILKWRESYSGQEHLYHVALRFAIEAVTLERIVDERDQFVGSGRSKSYDEARERVDRSWYKYLDAVEEEVYRSSTPYTGVSGPPCSVFNYAEVGRYLKTVSGARGAEEFEYSWIVMTLAGKLIRSWQQRVLLGESHFIAAYEICGERREELFTDTEDILAVFYRGAASFLDKTDIPVLGGYGRVSLRLRGNSLYSGGRRTILYLPAQPYPTALRDVEPGTVVFERDDLRIYFQHPSVYSISYKNEVIGCLDPDLINDDDLGKVVVQIETAIVVNGWAYSTYGTLPLRRMDPTTSPDLTAWTNPEDFMAIGEHALLAASMMERRGQAPYDGAPFDLGSSRAA